MKVGYFDCFSGASGDMILGALLDAGLPLDALQAELAKLPLLGYELLAQKDQRGGLAGTKARVGLAVDVAQPRRGLSDILAILAGSSLPQEVQEKSAAVFRRLAQAEAKVHGTSVEEVHFHEVGAVDAIVDVVGAVAGLRLLDIQEVYASALPAGGGRVRAAHGTLPVPAPATLELMALAGAPLRGAEGDEWSEGEMVTPTGAAILTTLASFRRPAFSLERIGHGLGSREVAGRPNLLRLWVGESLPSRRGDLVLLETNIDDMNPELFGYVMERLFHVGALDVWFSPIQMKKNRPATMLSVLTTEDSEGPVVEAVLQETSTLGIRIQRVQRHETGREVLSFESSLGPACVKLKRLPRGGLAISPEYEVCRDLAQRHNLPLQQVYRIISEDAERHIGR